MTGKKVFQKKVAEGFGVPVMENLVAFLMRKVTNASQTFRFRYMRTEEGRILYSENDCQQPKTYCNQIILTVLALRKMEIGMLFYLVYFYTFHF